MKDQHDHAVCKHWEEVLHFNRKRPHTHPELGSYCNCLVSEWTEKTEKERQQTVKRMNHKLQERINKNKEQAAHAAALPVCPSVRLSESFSLLVISRLCLD